MGGAAHELGVAVEHVLATDSRDLVDAALHGELVALQAQHDRLTVAIADRLAVWDTRQVWAADGSLSAAHRWARETKQSVRSGRAALRRARRWPTMPVARAAVLSGQLSLDHLELLARACSAERRAVFERDEAFLVGRLAALPFLEGAQLVEYWINSARDALTDERPHGDRGDGDRSDGDRSDGDGGDGDRPGGASRLFASTTIDGCVAFDGWLGPIEGSIVVDELERLERELYVIDQCAGVHRTRSQRMAAALVEMATRSATMPADGRRPRPLFTVLVGDHSFTRMCELANGTVLTPGQLVGYLDTALLETVLFDGPSTVLSVSHRRTFTGAVRRAIQVRDRRCQHPSGCDVPAPKCDIDHVVPVSMHGITSQHNGRLECTTHNRHASKHDHHATPRPEPSRPIDRLDELRARLRWRCNREPDPDPDDVVLTPR